LTVARLQVLEGQRLFAGVLRKFLFLLLVLNFRGIFFRQQPKLII